MGKEYAHYTNTMKVGELDTDEQLMGTVKRHPLGIIGMYITSGLGFVMILIVGLIAVPRLVELDATGRSLMALGVILIIILMALGLAAISYIYWRNQMVITDKNITVIAQKGLFNRQISQLSLANIEDVTSEKRGILQTIFDYGSLKVETAGEQFNFHFEFCQKPDVCAKQILECREKFIEYEPEVAMRANPRLEGLKR